MYWIKQIWTRPPVGIFSQVFYTKPEPVVSTELDLLPHSSLLQKLSS